MYNCRRLDIIELSNKTVYGGKNMTLHFVGGSTSDKLSVIKETKKYIVFRCHSNTMKYRYNKETGEVQDGTYHNVIKGMSLEL